MKKIPSIVAVEIPSSDTRIIHMKIDADLFWFQGHFATFPILPGVAQMEWVMLFSEQYFGEQLDFGGVVRLKFQQPIVPQEEITLELKYLRGGSITFQYHHEDSLKSSGRIKVTMKKVFAPVIVIPCFNHGFFIGKLIKELRNFEIPVIIVNDGSDQETYVTLLELKNSMNH